MVVLSSPQPRYAKSHVSTFTYTTMSQPLLHTALKLLFKNWFQVVGPRVAATTRVSVVGGLYIQARDIRYITVSIIYFSCATESGYSQLNIRTLTLSSIRAPRLTTSRSATRSLQATAALQSTRRRSVVSLSVRGRKTRLLPSVSSTTKW